jgi:predicted ATPase/DNA-binding XRE family transcriptional regulator
MNDPYSFGAWVRQRRRALDLTQAALARLVGVAKITVQKIEADARRPSHQVAELLAAQLQIPERDRAAFLAVARGERVADQLHAPRSDLPDTTNATGGHLPVQLTSFLGRAREIAELTELLQRPDVRLLTLTGAGGSGKTRLALRVAEELASGYPDGIWFVDLAPVSDPGQIAAVCLQALGIPEMADVSPLIRLQGWLRVRAPLLILDNYEHVLGAASFVSDLLGAAPTLQILVTSRIPLRLVGEQEYPVAPLAQPAIAPQSLHVLMGADSVALFLARAQAVLPPFQLTEANAAAVAAICARLDGLPLAIELAAARIRLFSPQQLHDRLTTTLLPVLTGGARNLPARQQTIHATIDWSYQLLTPDQQRLLARLSVFVGGWTLAAAEAIGGDGDTDVAAALDGLLHHSLVWRSEVAGEPRYTMLETIRAYARDRLRASGEAQHINDQHARYFTDLAEAAEPKLRSGDQLVWLRRLDADLENIQGALHWCLADAQADIARQTRGLQLAAALWYAWIIRARHTEAQRWLDHVAARDPRVALAIRARVLARAGEVLSRFDLKRSAQVAQESLPLAREASDPPTTILALFRQIDIARPLRTLPFAEEAVALADALGDPWYRCQSQALLSEVSEELGRADTIPRIRQSVVLARATGDRWLLAETLATAGVLVSAKGEQAEAHAMLIEAQACWEALESPLGLAIVSVHRANQAVAAGDYDTARAMRLQQVAIERALAGEQGIQNGLWGLGQLAHDQGAFTDALQYYTESLAIAERRGDGFHSAILQIFLGLIAMERGAHAESVVLATPGLRFFREGQHTGQICWALSMIAWMHYARGDSAAALVCCQECDELRSEVPHPEIQVQNWVIYGQALAHTGAGAQAHQMLQTCVDRDHIPASHVLRAKVLVALGQVHLINDDEASACRVLTQALPLIRQVGMRRYGAVVIEQAAAIAGLLGVQAAAARLWGAAEALREQIGAPLWPVDRSGLAQRVAEAQSLVPADVWDAAWLAGRALTWEQAADAALALFEGPHNT